MSPSNLPESPKGRKGLTPLQERFVKSGLEGFDDIEVFELFVSLISPDRNPKQAAHQIAKKFKTLRELLLASPQELAQAGISPRCIFGIKLLHELPVEVLKEKIIEHSVYKSSKEVFDYLNYSMRDLFEGTLDSIPIRPREIVESTIKYNATAVIFVHNHPTGDPTPSKTDKQLTRDLVFVGNIVQIKVLDHIIIGENRYFSFADEGLIEKYELDFLNLKIRGVSEAKRRLYQAELSGGLSEVFL